MAKDPSRKEINALAQHIQNLLTPSTPFFFNTLYDPFRQGADFVRGYPFSLREGVPTAISHGLWLNIPDFDAPTQLVKPLERNTRELLDSMQAGTLEPEVAFLNASLIPDVFLVLAAAHKTLIAKSRGSLITRTLHSELVYNYSGSKHISESLKRCGISDGSTYVLVARFNTSLDEMKDIDKLIHGTKIDLEELEGRADQAQIQKVCEFNKLLISCPFYAGFL